MKKIIKILIVNVFLLALFIVILDGLVYNLNKYSNRMFASYHFQYSFKNPYVFCKDIKTYFTDITDKNGGRQPEGLEYKSSPLLIFGCSFALGQWLEQSQTLGHKLSVILQRPVYNRAVGGQSLQEMYYQSENPVFYEQVPDSDSAIYVMIDDSIRRTYVTNCEFMETWFLLHYDVKKGKLVYQDYSNPVTNFLKSLYIVKLLNSAFYAWYTQSPMFEDKVTDDALLYFVKTRENLEKHWGHKINFYVLFYDDVAHSDMMMGKLSDNGFIVFSTLDLTDDNMKDSKYVIENDGHPSEAAWDLLAPIIAGKIEENER